MTCSNEKRVCQPATFITGNDQFSSGSFLTIEFGGYFNCRQTTDPDPTDDPYGTSGYTMALTGEPLLDQIIRLQWEKGKSNLRPSGVLDLREKVEAGVQVHTVKYNGQVHEKLSDVLAGATVNLADDILNDASNIPVPSSPMFISNNNVVGSDDTMAFVIEPFNLQIKKAFPLVGSPTHEKVEFEIHAVDVLAPSEPAKSAIEFDMPSAYERRLSYELITSSAAAHQAIGVFDEYGYFRDRRQWLGQQIELLTELESKLDRFADCVTGKIVCDDTVNWVIDVLQSEELRHQLGIYQNGCLVLIDFAAWQAAVNKIDELIKLLRDFIALETQACKTRIFQIETWGVRVTNKLGFQTLWKHDINCTRQIKINGKVPSSEDMILYLGGEIVTDQPWEANYWFGGWDGDLLIGYMAGSLQIPFKPKPDESC